MVGIVGWLVKKINKLILIFSKSWIIQKKLNKKIDENSKVKLITIKLIIKKKNQKQNCLRMLEKHQEIYPKKGGCIKNAQLPSKMNLQEAAKAI